MWQEEVIENILLNKNIEKSFDMSNYMRNKFEFLGIQSVERRMLTKEYFKDAKKSKSIDWKFVFDCWDNKYREVQYIALDYLKDMKKYLVKDDIDNLKKIITKKSWWDTIDNISGLVGIIVLENPELKEMMLLWSVNENFWIRRVSILFQLKLKDNLDTDLLETILENNFGSDEFFINKAIGWILREYSKVNKKWVGEYIEKNKDRLNILSIREGSKYI